MIGGKTIKTHSFGKTKEGKKVTCFELTNDTGMCVGVINYGGIITKIEVINKDGELGDVVLGYDNIEDYENNSCYFGCIVGRYANRIGGGYISLNDKNYQLFQNDKDNALHGGEKGFDKRIWKAKTFENENNVGVILNYVSAAGEEGYPGRLKCEVTYTLTKDNELEIIYKAETDKTTIINLTNHSYFNLKDGGISSILNHKLEINALYYTTIDEHLIPTGKFSSVEDTPFDFRKPTAIGERINHIDEQLQYGLGYDHNYVLNKDLDSFMPIAVVYEPYSGRIMEVLTTEPGLQFYSGNFLNNTIIGKQNITYQFRSGFCLETQHFPDSLNNPHFPSVVLDPGNLFKSKTVYRFSVKS